MNRAARTTLVHDRVLDRIGRGVGATVRPLSRFEWLTTDLEDPSNLHKPYGWAPPVEGPGAEDDGPTVTVAFCPALIADQTRFLYDAEYRAYLDIIEWSICLHIAHLDLPWPEREALIDKRLWDTAPGSMALLNRVQMRILDELTT